MSSTLVGCHLAGPAVLDPSLETVESVRSNMLQVARNLQDKPRAEWDYVTQNVAKLVDDVDYSSQTDSSGYLTPEAEHNILEALFLPGDDRDEDFKQGGLYTAWSLVEQFTDFWNNSEANWSISTLFVDDKRVVFTGTVSYGGNEFPYSKLLQAVCVFGLAEELNIVG